MSNTVNLIIVGASCFVAGYALGWYSQASDEQKKAIQDQLQKKAEELRIKKDEMLVSMFTKAIDLIWDKYDPSNKGYLKQEECATVVLAILKQVGKEEFFKKEIFETMFKEADKNQNGKLEKDEIAQLAVKILNGGE